ncbi:hypothetical protein GCM10009623_03430 [Nocardioides aestuarii]|uniref:NAD glycohydrolase translocation F5/8 type C domain-containing protein n=1 Tax=Nocardioides aestuarii TaxID=252231 RepID=A0ABW4TJ55_9ACTN
MPTTHHCARCGAGLGDGRFCTSCGEPVDTLADWRTDTAERPRVEAGPSAPAEPPTTATAPEPARFRLFADEDDEDDDHTEPTRVVPVAAYDAAYEEEADDVATPRRGGGSWVPWASGFAVMALIAGLGAFLLLADSDDPAESAADPAATEREPRERPANRSRDRTPEQTTEPEPAPDGPADLARYVGIEAPKPAPPSQDNSGNVVRYDVEQMVDGVPETTWRTPGDATGATITLTFDEPTVLSEVGLINGYAKVGQDKQGILDWYHGNRRVLAVEWSFDDGTVKTQKLGDTTIMQTVSLPQVETTAVKLKLLKVSPPGPGRASRDYTAISDVQLFGHTA